VNLGLELRVRAQENRRKGDLEEEERRRLVLGETFVSAFIDLNLEKVRVSSFGWAEVAARHRGG
jgi:hypothetical protein